MVGTKSALVQNQLVLVGDDVRRVESLDGFGRSIGWVPSTGALVVSYSNDITSEREDRLAIVTPDSGAVREIPLDHRISSTWSRIAVSSGGDIAYYTAQIPSAFEEAHDVWKVDLETGSMENITQSEMGEADPMLLNDETLAFIQYAPLAHREGPKGVLTVFDLTSGERRNVTEGIQTVTFFDTTIGGDWIVYSAFPENRREERAIWFVPSDGSLPPQLLLEDGGFDPQLSGDDSHILVRRVGGPNDPTVLEWVEVPDTAPWLD